VVIAGPANAGKSTLLNALMDMERAVVSELPGTTRDPVEGLIAIGHFPYRLTDTAGAIASEDPLDRASLELTRQMLREASLCLYLLDLSSPLPVPPVSFPLREDLPVIWVCNKADLDRRWIPSRVDWPGKGEWIELSAAKGTGLDRLLGLIDRQLALPLPPAGAPCVFTEHQERLLNKALEAGDLEVLEECLAAIERFQTGGVPLG
jgi:tRNA modification GTPase